MISAVPSVSSVHVELDDRLPSTAGRTDETTKPVLYQTRPNFLPRKVLKIDKETRKECNNVRYAVNVPDITVKYVVKSPDILAG